MINITEDIQWDETRPHSEQTQSALQWYIETIEPKLAYNKNDVENKIQPVCDVQDRPSSWIVSIDDKTYSVWREYMKPNSSEWGLKAITIYLIN